MQHFLVQFYNEGWFLKVPGATGRYTTFGTVPDLLRYHMDAGPIETSIGSVQLIRPFVLPVSIHSPVSIISLDYAAHIPLPLYPTSNLCC